MPEDQTRTAFEKWYKFFQTIRAYTDSLGGIDDIVYNPERSTPRKIMAGFGSGGKVLYTTAKMYFNLIGPVRNGGSVGQSDILALHRAMIRTGEHSYIGLAPRDVKVGDAITLFEGCKMPIVLREINSPVEAER
ncbi:hypothetical protein QBC37DRAFT_462887 [Rhypophila decipiens]|uniref:Uncharacterized protein n=1 Tax=Rhypophila decipiens TaxID=261697 RepID=A0AAN6Y873_9PEZI|nr:hypothetical protein QBC37DRAFT_462887 [Rhypophila decipiens]